MQEALEMLQNERTLYKEKFENCKEELSEEKKLLNKRNGKLTHQ